MLLLQINANPANINILQVYAPITDQKSDNEVIKFYSKIIEALKKLPKKDLIITMGDFNAKVGEGRSGNLIGSHGIGVRNERGELLSRFVEEQEFVVTNTRYRLPPRKLYTSKSPRDAYGKIIRNQIDYTLVNRRYRNSCSSVKTYPGADLQSDHNPLVATFKVRMKKI